MKSLLKLPPDATRFIALRAGKQWLLVRVFAVLAGYKCLLLFVPFRYFLPSGKPSTFARKPLPENLLSDTIWAIQVLSNRLPLGFTCLVQALAAKRLLSDYSGVHIHIGVHKSKEQVFSAHAWVVYQGKTILGEQAGQTFTPILDWN